MLKIFTDLSHYNSNQRKYLADILRPFLPNNRFSEFGIDKDIIVLVNTIEESHICLLPMSWNYYVDTNQINIAKRLILKAEAAEKKILIWVKGDYFIYSLNFNNIIVCYAGLYQSIQRIKTLALPVIITDPLSFINLDSIQFQKYNQKPSIGFCGQTDPNLIVSLFKMTKLIYKNFKYYFHLSNNYPGSITPPTYLRKKVLDILECGNDVHTDFVRRDRYQGGGTKNMVAFNKIKQEFYQNIQNTDYTLCIRGTGNFSARFYETLALGRVPIFINTDCILPFNKIIDWRQHVILVDQSEIIDIGTKVLIFHNSLTHDSFISLQKKNRQLWEEYFSFSGFVTQLVPYLKKEL